MHGIFRVRIFWRVWDRFPMSTKYETYLQRSVSLLKLSLSLSLSLHFTLPQIGYWRWCNIYIYIYIYISVCVFVCPWMYVFVCAFSNMFMYICSKKNRNRHFILKNPFLSTFSRVTRLYNKLFFFIAVHNYRLKKEKPMVINLKCFSHKSVNM